MLPILVRPRAMLSFSIELAQANTETIMRGSRVAISAAMLACDDLSARFQFDCKSLCSVIKVRSSAYSASVILFAFSFS